MTPAANHPRPRRLDASQWRAILAERPLYFDVTSGSMKPTFRPGDQVLIRPLEEGEPRPGQIVVFFRGGLVTHRYLGEGVCRGDNALENDPPVAREQMVGIATERKREEKITPLKDRKSLGARLLRALTLPRRVRRRVRRLIGDLKGR